MNTLKRILDVLHCRVEDILKPWASYLPVVEDKKSVPGEQMNGITVLLRTKYKNYMQATVEKLVSNVSIFHNLILFYCFVSHIHYFLLKRTVLYVEMYPWSIVAPHTYLLQKYNKRSKKSCKP